MDKVNDAAPRLWEFKLELARNPKNGLCRAALWYNGTIFAKSLICSNTEVALEMLVNNISNKINDLTRIVSNMSISCEELSKKADEKLKNSFSVEAFITKKGCGDFE